MCTTNIIELVQKHLVNPAFFRLAFMWRKHQRWAWPSSGEKKKYPAHSLFPENQSDIMQTFLSHKTPLKSMEVEVEKKIGFTVCPPVHTWPSNSGLRTPAITRAALVWYRSPWRSPTAMQCNVDVHVVVSINHHQCSDGESVIFEMVINSPCMTFSI